MVAGVVAMTEKQPGEPTLVEMIDQLMGMYIEWERAGTAKKAEMLPELEQQVEAIVRMDPEKTEVETLRDTVAKLMDKLRVHERSRGVPVVALPPGPEPVPDEISGMFRVDYRPVNVFLAPGGLTKEERHKRLAERHRRIQEKRKELLRKWSGL